MRHVNGQQRRKVCWTAKSCACRQRTGVFGNGQEVNWLESDVPMNRRTEAWMPRRVTRFDGRRRSEPGEWHTSLCALQLASRIPCRLGSASEAAQFFPTGDSGTTRDTSKHVTTVSTTLDGATLFGVGFHGLRSSSSLGGRWTLGWRRRTRKPWARCPAARWRARGPLIRLSRRVD